MLLALQGSVLEPRGDHLVVRTPADPLFRWGNFLLLREPVAPGAGESWLRTFRREFPDTGHRALGVDGTDGRTGEVTGSGLTVERSTVLTAAGVHPPPHPHPDAEFRMLHSEADWHAAAQLKIDNNVREPPAQHRIFARRRISAMRALQDAGHGGWFGAFLDGRMVTGLGLFTDGSGLGRFQSVDTHPEYRNRGLAGTLVYTASRYALRELGVRTLVMVADPDDVAIRVYRSVGFTGTETQTRLESR